MSGLRQGQYLDFLGVLGALLVFQVAALVRYWSRLPGDWLGIGLYFATILLTGLAGALALKRLVSE